METFSCFVYLLMPILIAQAHDSVFSAPVNECVSSFGHAEQVAVIGQAFLTACVKLLLNASLTPERYMNTTGRGAVAPLACPRPDVGYLESDPVGRKLYVILIW